MINIVGNRKRSVDLDLVPLINIVFLLLIFFMLTSSSISGVLKAELPEAQSADKVHEKNIIVKISRSGLLELNGEPIEGSALKDLMIQALAMNKIKTIEIHGDKNIQFELFGKIIEQIRMAGAEDFIFATEKPKGP